jgi:hypothetical protein
MCLNMTDTLMNTDSIDNRLKGHVNDNDIDEYGLRFSQ